MTWKLPDKLVPKDFGCDGLPSPSTPLLNADTPGSSARPSLAAGVVDKRLTRLSILDASSAVPLNGTMRVNHSGSREAGLGLGGHTLR